MSLIRCLSFLILTSSIPTYSFATLQSNIVHPRHDPQIPTTAASNATRTAVKRDDPPKTIIISIVKPVQPTSFPDSSGLTVTTYTEILCGGNPTIWGNIIYEFDNVAQEVKSYRLSRPLTDSERLDFSTFQKGAGYGKGPHGEVYQGNTGACSQYLSSDSSHAVADQCISGNNINCFRLYTLGEKNEIKVWHGAGFGT